MAEGNLQCKYKCDSLGAHFKFDAAGYFLLTFNILVPNIMINLRILKHQGISLLDPGDYMLKISLLGFESQNE